MKNIFEKKILQHLKNQITFFTNYDFMINSKRKAISYNKV